MLDIASEIKSLINCYFSVVIWFDNIQYSSIRHGFVYYKFISRHATMNRMIDYNLLVVYEIHDSLKCSLSDSVGRIVSVLLIMFNKKNHSGIFLNNLPHCWYLYYSLLDIYQYPCLSRNFPSRLRTESFGSNMFRIICIIQKWMNRLLMNNNYMIYICILLNHITIVFQGWNISFSPFIQ